MGIPENEPEAKLSWTDRRKGRLLRVKEKTAAKREIRAERFANTAMGRWWAPKKEKLEQTEQGKLVLKGLAVLKSLAKFALAIALLVGLRIGFDTFLYPTDYNLTQAQKDEGYSRTSTGGYKSSHPEDVYYRFYTDDEIMNDPDCSPEMSWCVYALSGSKNCPKIVMEFSTSEDDTLFSSSLEYLETSVAAKDPNGFKLGERVTLGVISKDPKANYGQVEHIYCQW